MLVKSLHLAAPFLLSDEGPGASDEHAPDIPASLEFAQNQPGLNGLSNTDAVCYEQSRPVGTDEFQYGTELVGDQLNARGMERVEIRYARMKELQGCQVGMEFSKRSRYQ
jgi:hypothetical protein